MFDVIGGITVKNACAYPGLDTDDDDDDCWGVLIQ
jgi:hypothetical protein